MLTSVVKATNSKRCNQQSKQVLSASILGSSDKVQARKKKHITGKTNQYRTCSLLSSGAACHCKGDPGWIRKTLDINRLERSKVQS
jgi:hypothetical protein